MSMDELKRRLHAKYANLRDAFRAIDVDSDNTLSHAEVPPPRLQNDLSLCARRLLVRVFVFLGEHFSALPALLAPRAPLPSTSRAVAACRLLCG